jgi:hypothetical protein
MKKVGRSNRWWVRGALLAPLVLAPAAVTSEGESSGPAGRISFMNITLDPASGITYRRAPSPLLLGQYDALKIKPFMSLAELHAGPLRPHGSPGAAILDYDNDGDEDVFVTNGPGRPNSLLRNQLVETGQTRFVDVGASAGIGATDMDATGVCFGDTDNDGDSDVMVLGRMEPNRLFRNNGNGSFSELAFAGVGGGNRAHTGCTMGDVNGDGLLDIFVANSFDWFHRQAIYSDLYAWNHPNDLYLNTGDNMFADASDTSGIRNLYRTPTGEGSITWAQAMVDLDADGDVDIIHGDDNGGLPPSAFAGVDRGYVQLFKNDGAGQFTNATGTSGSTLHSSAWMGVSFGDFNCDGHLDFFMSSTGDYFFPQFGIATPPGLDSSRWNLALSDGSGAYFQPAVGELIVTNFGWGTGTADYDNDGDTDIIVYGGLDTSPLQTADNPGTILVNNGCEAQFSWDQYATSETAERTLRQDVMGVALGDLNDDGFVDIVTTSGQYVPPTIPLVKMNTQWGSAFDATAFFLPVFAPIGPFEWEWMGHDAEEGMLDVKLSSASNGNNWVKLRARGSVGLTPRAVVNRDGIGAIVYFTPAGGKTVMMPVLGGSSHLSQHSLTQGFGLGAAAEGTAEILWPGGVRTRLYDVAAGERLAIPELPCDFSAAWQSRNAFRKCVNDALNDLRASGAVSRPLADRLRFSALRAYDESH